MKHTSETPFDGIESAHEFLGLLSQCVGEAKVEIDGHVAREISQPSRRLDALRIAQYKLEKLQEHVDRSVRLLNDLRSLRRLVFEDRGIVTYQTVPAIALAEPVIAAAQQPRTPTRKPDLVAA